MSLSVGASASTLISQLLASLYQTDNNNEQSTPSNSDANTTSNSTASSNSLVGTGKPSFSDDVLTTFMQLQQSQENQSPGDFLDPAKTRVENTPQRPALASQSDTLTLAHNNLMRAIHPDLPSNTTTTPAGVSAADTTTSDDEDDTTSEASTAGFQTASKAAFGF